MEQKIIIGVDVSKLTLDIFVKPAGEHAQIGNTSKAIARWLKHLCGRNDYRHLFVLMEHTGRYSRQLEQALSKQDIPYCKLPALQIMRSLGMVRGKNDKVDAARIAEYGWLRRETLVADLPVPEIIISLRDRLTLRTQLVKDRSRFICRLKEIKSIGSTDHDLIAFYQHEIAHASANIKKLEQQIKVLIKNNEGIKRTFELLTSIKGVALIVATQMICKTNNFARFSNARKFNCYAGLPPFTHQSGTSIKSKSRISHLADKQMKTLLTQSARSAARYDPELKAYYQRRVREGKNKKQCLNIIKAKIVARMFAVVKRQTPYALRIAS